jgi:hypothetical protein
MIADLVITVVVYRDGGSYRAECPEFGLEARAMSMADAHEELVAEVRRHLETLAARGTLETRLGEAGFVVSDGVLRTESRLVSVEEARIAIPF